MKPVIIALVGLGLFTAPAFAAEHSEDSGDATEAVKEMVEEGEADKGAEPTENWFGCDPDSDKKDEDCLKDGEKVDASEAEQPGMEDNEEGEEEDDGEGEDKAESDG